MCRGLFPVSIDNAITSPERNLYATNCCLMSVVSSHCECDKEF